MGVVVAVVDVQLVPTVVQQLRRFRPTKHVAQSVCDSSSRVSYSLLSEIENNTTHNHRLTAIIQVNLRQPASPVRNRRILLVQSFTARQPAHSD